VAQKKGSGKKLSLFLKEGSPEGPIEVSIEGSSLKVFSLPRSHLGEYRKTSGGKRGIYLLIGQSLTQTNTFDIYVGESKGIEDRVASHDARNEKTFERIILMFTSDDKIYGHHAKYIESILIQFLKCHPVATLQNKDAGTAERLQEDEENTCWQKLNELALIMQSLGYWFMKDFEDADWENDPKALIEKYGNPSSPSPIHKTSELRLVSPSVIVPPRLTETIAMLPFEQWPIFEFKDKRKGKAFHGYMKIHSVKQFELLSHSVTYYENKGIYTSPSAVLWATQGRGLATWTVWKTPEGETLREFNKRHGNPLDDRNA
jgi:hypothetical protein